MSAGYDLVIFQGIQLRGDAPIALGLGTTGLACRGVQKAAQTFTTLFLTDQGSDPRDTARGTTFMNRLRSGQIAEATLTRWQFDYDTLRIWVQVITRAGTSRVYELPIASLEGLE